MFYNNDAIEHKLLWIKCFKVYWTNAVSVAVCRNTSEAIKLNMHVL